MLDDKNSTKINPKIATIEETCCKGPVRFITWVKKTGAKIASSVSKGVFFYF